MPKMPHLLQAVGPVWPGQVSHAALRCNDLVLSGRAPVEGGQKLSNIMVLLGHSNMAGRGLGGGGVI